MELIRFRKANESDLILYFNWANDPLVRVQSYNSDKVSIIEHTNWFLEKLNDNSCYLYIFQNELNEYIGQVRIQKTEDCDSIIGISIDSNFRGKGLGTQMLQLSAEEFFRSNPNAVIQAYVKFENTSSKRIFEKAGYQMVDEILYNNIKSFHFIKYANREF
jgi:RimJ/RimL family protein N-acetyltransferase